MDSWPGRSSSQPVSLYAKPCSWGVGTPPPWKVGGRRTQGLCPFSGASPVLADSLKGPSCADQWGLCPFANSRGFIQGLPSPLPRVSELGDCPPRKEELPTKRPPRGREEGCLTVPGIHPESSRPPEWIFSAEAELLKFRHT